jgi:hypothetical protein
MLAALFRERFFTLHFRCEESKPLENRTIVEFFCVSD